MSTIECASCSFSIRARMQPGHLTPGLAESLGTRTKDVTTLSEVVRLTSFKVAAMIRELHISPHLHLHHGYSWLHDLLLLTQQAISQASTKHCHLQLVAPESCLCKSHKHSNVVQSQPNRKCDVLEQPHTRRTSSAAATFQPSVT